MSEATPKARRSGTIKKVADGKWLVRIFLGRINGKREYHAKTVHGNKKDAETYLNAALRDRDLGQFAPASKDSVESYMARWLSEVKKPQLSTRTHEDYCWQVSHYITPTLGKIRLDKLTPMDIQALLNKLSGQGLSPRTVQIVLTRLRDAFTQAVKWKLLSSNPASLVEAPRQVKKELTVMEPEQAQLFVETARADEHGTVLIFAACTGMRPGEYLALKWPDLDWNAGRVTVQRALARTSANGGLKRGGWEIKETKTASSVRSLKLPPQLLELLKEHKAKQDALRFKLGAEYEDMGLIFPNHFGRPLNGHNLRQRSLQRILEKAKLPRLTLYALRHGVATAMLIQGQHPRVVSDQLGNSPVLVMRTYMAKVPRLQEQAALRLGDSLFGGAAKKPTEDTSGEEQSQEGQPVAPPLAQSGTIVPNSVPTQPEALRLAPTESKSKKQQTLTK